MIELENQEKNAKEVIAKGVLKENFSTLQNIYSKIHHLKDEVQISSMDPSTLDEPNGSDTDSYKTDLSSPAKFLLKETTQKESTVESA
jgi:hypothetical protein